MSDTISIRGLRVRGHHGVLPEERRDGQVFVVDATLTVDTSAAVAADDLAETVDYGAVARRLADIVAGEPADLVETVAHRLADNCLRFDRVTVVEIALHKPQAPLGVPVEDVVVTVRKSRPA